MGFPGGSAGKESAHNVGDLGSIPGLGRIPGGGHGGPFQYPCLENPQGQRSLEGHSPWGHKELDTTERLNTEAKNMRESTQVNSERAVPNRRGLDCSHGAVFWVVFGQSSCLCPYLAYACISLGQDGAQHGSHEVGRTYRACGSSLFWPLISSEDLFCMYVG